MDTVFIYHIDTSLSVSFVSALFTHMKLKCGWCIVFSIYLLCPILRFQAVLLVFALQQYSDIFACQRGVCTVCYINLEARSTCGTKLLSIYLPSVA